MGGCGVVSGGLPQPRDSLIDKTIYVHVCITITSINLVVEEEKEEIIYGKFNSKFSGKSRNRSSISDDDKELKRDSIVSFRSAIN